MCNQCMWGAVCSRNTSSLLSVICSWILSSLYMTGAKTSTGPSYTPKVWKMRKQWNFCIMEKILRVKALPQVKKQQTKPRRSMETAFGEMSLSDRSTAACAQLIPLIRQVSRESLWESHRYCLLAALVSAVPSCMVWLDISFWTPWVIKSLLGPWEGTNFALWFDCRQQKRPNFGPLPVVGNGVSSLRWWSAHTCV